MKKISLVKMLGILLFSVVAVPLAQAQATRTWVSGVGDDANPCSRTAPCKTFAGAISKTATAGEINVLDPGGFGAVTITKAITIDGSNGSIAGVLVSGTNGIVINAPTTDTVVLRNLDIDGIGTGLNGINVINAKAVHVENCRIYGFLTTATGSGNGILFAPNTGTVSSLFVTNTKVFNNTSGIFIKPTSPVVANATLTDVIVQQNNGFGIRSEGGANTVISHNAVNGNGSNGIVGASLDARLVTVSIDNTVSSNNTNWGVSAGVNATVFLSNMQITGNGGGAVASGAGATLSSFHNNNAGNNTAVSSTPTIVSQY